MGNFRGLHSLGAYRCTSSCIACSHSGQLMPLHFAAFFGPAEACKELMDINADPQRRSASGETSLQLAKLRGCNDTCARLFQSVYPPLYLQLLTRKASLSTMDVEHVLGSQGLRRPMSSHVYHVH